MDRVVIKEWKKFRRYNDGAEYYGMSRRKFEQLAKDDTNKNAQQKPEGQTIE